MKRRTLALHPAARQDLIEIWLLINNNDGPTRADGVVARIEAFVRSLEEFSDIGRHHDEQRAGLRSCSVPGLSTVTLVFFNTTASVVVLRIGYLGRNVMAALPTLGQ